MIKTINLISNINIQDTNFDNVVIKNPTGW